MATLYKKRGYWYIDYFIGKKKNTRNTKLSASEANKKRAEKLKEGIENLIPTKSENNISLTDIISGEITLNKAIEMYKNIFLVNRSKSHQECFYYVMERFRKIVPGTTNVKQIKNSDITNFITSIKSLAKATQVTYFQYVASLLEYLKGECYIDHIPIKKGTRPKKGNKNIITFDPVDLENILNEAKIKNLKYYHFFKMLLLTGQRPCDVVRLRVRDVDFHRNIIYLGVSKTSSEFKFPIYKMLELFLKNELNIQTRINKDEYLFPGMTVNAAGITYRNIKKKLGLNRLYYYTLKTFRKNFATDISEIGMTIQEVQALLDHTSTDTTLRYYANVKTEEMGSKIDRLQAKDSK